MFSKQLTINQNYKKQFLFLPSVTKDTNEREGKGNEATNTSGTIND